MLANCVTSLLYTSKTLDMLPLRLLPSFSLVGFLLIAFHTTVSAQCSLAELFDGADVVLQGEIVSDTVYEANGWVYTSYLIEPCTSLTDDQTWSRGKPLAITRMGGDLDGVSYSRPHGLEIFGGEQAVFFLKYIEGDTITPNDLTSVQPICGQAGFAKYLTDDWKPIVAMGETVLSAVEFRTQMKEYIEFEYCESYPSYYVAAPSLTFEDGSPVGGIGFAYESHNQLPAQPMTIEFQFEEPVADQALDNASFFLSEAIDYDAESIDSFTISVTYYLDSFPTYLDSIVSLGTVDYSFDELSALSNVRVIPVDQAVDTDKSALDRIIYQDDTPGKEGFKRARITEITPEVVAGIRRPLSLPNLAGAPNPPTAARPGIVTITGTDFNNYTTAELGAKIPNDVRIEMMRESGDFTGVTISPLAGDIISWTDTEINFYAPTYGYLDYSISNPNMIGESGAFGGRIRVITEDGNDQAPFRTEVFFNQKSSSSFVASRVNPSTDDNSLRKQSHRNGQSIESTERGYTFVLAPTFVTSLRDGVSDLADAKLDLCDAAAEWTKATGIPIDIVDTCPPDINCSVITGNRIPVTSTDEDALAAGLTSVLPQTCAIEEPRVQTAELRFNNTFVPRRFTSRARSFLGQKEVIYDQALHEFGHILQLLHVDNRIELMFPSASAGNSLTSAAVACGIHVNNVSLSYPTLCGNVIQKDFIPTDCATSPIQEISNRVDGVKVLYDQESSRLLVEIESQVTKQLQLTVYDVIGRPVKVESCSIGLNTISLDESMTGFYSAVLNGSQTQIAIPFVKN